ncbi:hypothetical protein SRB5_33230 [Streptomyces sp. RB5]|uniref:Calcineurin-like phosphoesterase domain-containing protein n=1 Tax=Streptomyces smaragdinus TaxID=2585196 RepID=A0A7K0CI72_9ACTN|nr:metallophosphoesterase family protein [Streptomyces smaragdinus]MQY13180.1 hypothetical protein [Streptomyces smaragdinus]
MIIAVLSDIHGVLPALEAVLAEPDVHRADLIALTGDIASGPLPVETLDVLTALGERALWISGNGEREVVGHRRGEPATDPVTAWSAEQLRPDQVDLLAGLPKTAAVGGTLFCHATPRDDVETVLVDSSSARWSDVLAGVAADVDTIVCGHTHVPFVRLAHGRLVVNPGSIGMPYGRSGAHWALLSPDGGVTLRRTEYDYAAACARITAASGYPDAAAWADEYVYARNSAEDALEAFGPLDGRITP